MTKTTPTKNSDIILETIKKVVFYGVFQYITLAVMYFYK